MKIRFSKSIVLGVIIATITLPGPILSAQHSSLGEDLSGHFSRAGNSDTPSKTTRNNIYIKFFADRWIEMIFVPYPYAVGVEPSTITRVMVEAKKQTSGSAYMKGKFGHLSELATVHIERYGYLEGRIVFECGSLAPCTIKLGEGYLELIKPGVINEHIIRYNHVAAE